MIPNEIALATPMPTTAAPSPSTGSSRWWKAGSPSAPRPRLEIVMPSWHAARYESMCSIACLTDFAPGVPSLDPLLHLAGRSRAIANSVATKKPFAATRTSARAMFT